MREYYPIDRRVRLYELDHQIRFEGIIYLELNFDEVVNESAEPECYCDFSDDGVGVDACYRGGKFYACKSWL